MIVREIGAEDLAPFDKLFHAFDNAGKQFFAVGGCVRDLLIGKKPKDFDFTTDATPAEIKNILTQNGFVVLPIGEAYGTIATLIARKQYEITAFRVKESYTHGSRHPSVVFGTDLSEDLARRDLTVNAIAVNRHGKLFDPFDGRGDLARGVLRVPRNSYQNACEIFEDDPLRILRLARFLGRLGFDVDPDTENAAKDKAHEILSISEERKYQEIFMTLQTPFVAEALNWLRKVGVFQRVLPEFLPVLSNEGVSFDDLSLDCARPEPHNRGLWQKTLEAVRLSANQPSILWSAFLGFLGIPPSLNENNALGASRLGTSIGSEILHRLKASNATIDAFKHQQLPFPTHRITKSEARRKALELGEHVDGHIAYWRVLLTLLTPEIHNTEIKEIFEHNAHTLSDLSGHAAVILPNRIGTKIAERYALSGRMLGTVIRDIENAVIDEILEDHPNEEQIYAFLEKERKFMPLPK